MFSRYRIYRRRKVMVNYGDTIIISTIKSEVAEPEVANPEKGF